MCHQHHSRKYKTGADRSFHIYTDYYVCKKQHRICEKDTHVKLRSYLSFVGNRDKFQQTQVLSFSGKCRRRQLRFLFKRMNHKPLQAWKYAYQNCTLYQLSHSLPLKHGYMLLYPKEALRCHHLYCRHPPELKDIR